MQGKYRYRVAYGGRASGKSHEMHLMALLKAMKEKMTILCTRETMTSIKDSVHATLSRLIDDYALSGFQVTEHKITHKNGSKFIFAGLRTNVDSIKSLQGVNLCIIEEAANISQESWDKLNPTIREEGSEIWVIFNPNREDDPMYQMFVVNPPKRAKVIKSNYTDNPFCSEESKKQAEECKERDYEAYLHIWEGELNKKSDSLVFAGKYTTSLFQTPDNVDFLYGLDFGFSTDPTALTRSFIVGKTLYIDQELYGYHVETDHLPAFLERLPNIKKAVIRADNARPETISYLNRHGFTVKAATKGKGSVEDGISYLRSFDKIIIHERCQNTIKEFKTYSYKINKTTGDILPDLEDKNNHAIDSLRYAHEPLIKGNKGPRIRVVSW